MDMRPAAGRFLVAFSLQSARVARFTLRAARGAAVSHPFMVARRLPRVCFPCSRRRLVVSK
eukprot:7147405-Lingulodinium_polyedra.AAC.1